MSVFFLPANTGIQSYLEYNVCSINKKKSKLGFYCANEEECQPQKNQKASNPKIMCWLLVLIWICGDNFSFWIVFAKVKH